MGNTNDDAARSKTTSGRVKTSITLPWLLFQRIRRAAAIEKRTVSSEIEYVLERHVNELEREHGLSATSIEE